MGYKLQETLTLDFEGTSYDGAEVVLDLTVSSDKFFEILEAAQNAKVDGEWVIDRLRNLNNLIGDSALISWNLEDKDDLPIPATAEGFSAIPPKLATLITQQWMVTVQGNEDPLSDKSSNGNSPAILSAEMANLSLVNQQQL